MARVELLTKTTTIPTRKLLLKALRLADASKGVICIFAKDYQRSEDHVFLDFFLPEAKRRQSLSDNYLKWSAQVLEKIDIIAKEEEIKYEVEMIRLEGRRWFKQMLLAFVSSNRVPLLVDHSTLRITSELVSILAKADRNVLLLTDKSWIERSRVFAAIDPLHREDKHGRVDETVITAGEDIAGMLNMSLQLAYCRHVPGYLNEYKKEILESQKRGVLDFISDNNLESIPVSFTRGNPEFALPELVKLNKASLLVMGACKRGSVSRFWTGSTVDVMLKEPPCDLLLVTHLP